MPTDDTARSAAIDRLRPLVGEWTVAPRSDFPDPPDFQGRSVFEWILDGAFLVQRTEVRHPDAPDSVSVIAYDTERGAFTQHYFDSRGVVRLYEMTLADGVWRLSRLRPDFSPLAFAQRFEGTFSDGGDVIEGRWERSHDGSTWEKDFDIVFTRAAG